ncbi:N-acetylmuramoyl-L-alanine amidase [Bacillus songklensis]|uniref:N-acetylmuramoyl-L-alanine amidase n=1 Tax=Bacillus songklensis TaxID=1069116 RepID=A0ABV8B0D0_9BACI
MERLLRIWIDAGHGGKDPGAVANGLLEKVLVLLMQVYLIDYLKSSYKGFVVEATRTTDVFETLDKRADRANTWDADVFMSLHINAGGGTGYESFIYTKASSGSISLQQIVNEEALAVAKKYGLDAHGGTPAKRGNLAVIRETNMPAILMETAYIDSKDAALLKDDSFLRDMAEAYARGIAKFLGLQPKVIENPRQGVAGVSTYIDNQPPQKFRLETGNFKTEEEAEEALNKLKQKYLWIIRREGKKLVTGTWTDAAVVQKYKTEWKQTYKWWVYIKEA